MRSLESSMEVSTEDSLALNVNEGISCSRICRAPKHHLRLDVDAEDDEHEDAEHNVDDVYRA